MLCFLYSKRTTLSPSCLPRLPWEYLLLVTCLHTPFPSFPFSSPPCWLPFTGNAYRECCAVRCMGREATSYWGCEPRTRVSSLPTDILESSSTHSFSSITTEKVIYINPIWLEIFHLFLNRWASWCSGQSTVEMDKWSCQKQNSSLWVLKQWTISPRR